MAKTLASCWWPDCMCQGPAAYLPLTAVQTAGTKAMREVCAVVGNRDIEPFIPVLVSCIARPAEVPDCVHKLGATTFVQVRAHSCCWNIPCRG